MSGKIRLLDLSEKQFTHWNRKECYSRILCGEILLNGEKCRDPHRLVSSDVQLKIRKPGFVSRGGYKLEAALLAWKPEISGKIGLDVGASTGGFTDCLLQYGAAAVHAVDVGTNQLHYALRTNPRVLVQEKTNISAVHQLNPKPDFAAADLSFRSLRGVCVSILKLTQERWMLALIKPQFELRKSYPEFRGVIHDPAQREEAVQLLLRDLQEEGITIAQMMQSPLLGTSGNCEYLALFKLL